MSDAPLPPAWPPPQSPSAYLVREKQTRNRPVFVAHDHLRRETELREGAELERRLVRCQRHVCQQGLHLRPPQVVCRWLFPGGDSHRADVLVALCPKRRDFFYSPYWHHRLVVVVAGVPPNVVELILRQLAQVNGSFLRLGNPLLRRGEFCPQLAGSGNSRGLTLEHVRGRRRSPSRY